MKKKNYEVDGLIFHSIKELSKHSGKHEKTIAARLRKGMTPQEACSKTDFRCNYYEDNGEKKSISQICVEQSKDTELIRNRLKYGYSLKEALNRPKKVSRQGQPIVVYGILYNSISDACRRLNRVDKEGTIRSRLRAGKTPDEAFRFEDSNSKQPINGMTHLHLMEQENLMNLDNVLIVDPQGEL